MVLLVIIGAMIGAGFASGQEIYLFFYRYGIKGIYGLILCNLLISIIIYKVLKIIFNNDIKSYEQFLDIIFKRNKENKYLNISYITNIIINIFLLVSFFIMISGFGAYFNQEFNLNNYIGSGILAIICYFIFLKDMKGVTKVNSIVVPILIFFIVLIGIKNINLINFQDIGKNVLIKENFLNNWFVQSIIYCSYNIILLLPVIVNLKKYIKNRRDIKYIALFSGIILFILSISIFLLLVNIKVDFGILQMPAIYAISNISLNLKTIYGIVILLSIFTTAISIGMSFLENIVKNKKSIPQFALIMCITGVIISNFGFSSLVNLLFPTFGYLGLIQVIYILLN